MPDGDRNDRLVYRIVSHLKFSGKGKQVRLQDGDGDETTEWFPKSIVDWTEREIVMPRWLAMEKGLGRAVRTYTVADAEAAGDDLLDKGFPEGELDRRRRERQERRQARRHP